MNKLQIYNDYELLMRCIYAGTPSPYERELAKQAVYRFKDIALSGQDERPPCKCSDHRIDAHAYFIKKHIPFSNINERDIAHVVKLNYCPECGRKL
jgi:hypothetical protein